MEELQTKILDKLHGIAEQLGIMNEFFAWLKRAIEEEMKAQKHATAGAGTK